MKIFLLTLIGFITLIVLTSCGLIYTTKGAPTKEQKELVKKYAGLYVFNKKLRDEVIQREKEREEYSQNRLKMIEEEKEKILRSLFTEKEIQDFRDMVARDRERRVVRQYFDEVYEKENEIFRELTKKYPDLIDNKFPETLSNGSKYYHNYQLNIYGKEYEPYIQKIKEYMGYENYNKLNPNIEVGYVYAVKKDNVKKEIPIELFIYLSWDKTTYGIYGDEAAGVRFTETDKVVMSNYGNVFYLIDNQFVKHKREYQMR